MSLGVTLATARRVLSQLRHDGRTMALLLLFPTVLMVLVRYMFDSGPAFGRIAPALLAILPFTIMFMVTSVGTLRERRGGTLERLMTMPIGRFDFLLGYGIAFGLTAVVQVAIVATVTLTWLGLDIAGSIWLMLLVVVLDALLGTALGLLVSAFARSEFQAIQFMPVVVMPQAFLCGLFVARDQMARFLELVSNVLPLTYAVDAMKRVTASSAIDADVVRDLVIIAGASVLALLLGALTLRRQTR
jgi:ABC-2 type transport system permease protein